MPERHAASGVTRLVICATEPAAVLLNIGGVPSFCCLWQFHSPQKSAAVQGIESNVRHHRRFIPMLWGEQRENDYYKDFPHGGRLDMRFTRANNVNGTLYSEHGYSVDPNTVPVAEQGIPAPWAFPVPAQHYSHMLNYDYFKVNQPYVCLLDVI